MNDLLLGFTQQEFQQLYQEVELKLEKLQNKNNVIQQNLDVDYIKKELYTMIKQEMDELQLFITEIKEQMNLLEKNVNSLDSKNKVKRLKETYLKEIQRNKAICRTLNNKSSFQSEKQNDEISIKSQSDTGGQPEMILPQRLDYNESNVQQSKISVEQDQKPLIRSSNILEQQQSVNNEQVVEQEQKVEEEEEEEEEMNKYIYFIILVLVGIIAGLIVWLLYDENIL